jgi:hypothetical protein
MQLHGAEIVDGLDEFYSAIVELFGGGNLGGIRFVANKPLHQPLDQVHRARDE